MSYPNSVNKAFYQAWDINIGLVEVRGFNIEISKPGFRKPGFRKDGVTK